MNNSLKNITIFGGSNPKPGEPAYEQAYQLGKLLGLAQATVITGGYMGTMEAVSRGAVESGGYSIGVTCDEIERWRPIGPNPWVQKELRCSTLVQRIIKLIDLSEAVIILPGGIGTLAELTLLWNYIEIQVLPPRPVILFGTIWKKIIDHFFEQFAEYIPNKQRRWLIFSNDIYKVLNILEDYWGKNE